MDNERKDNYEETVQNSQVNNGDNNSGNNENNSSDNHEGNMSYNNNNNSYNDNRNDNGYNNNGGYDNRGGGYDSNRGGYDNRDGYGSNRGYDNRGGYGSDRGYDNRGGYGSDRGYDNRGGYGNQSSYGNDNNYNNNSGYGNNNNYGSHNHSQRDNNNKNRTRIIAIVCGVFFLISMTAVVGTFMNKILANVEQKAGSDEIAWNDSANGKEESDGKDSDSNNSDVAVATTEPVTVNQSSGDTASINDVSGIVESVMPSVVSIISTSSVKGYSIFGQEYEQEMAASGTGFIIGKNDKELLFATNNHVVENTTAIQITFIDDTTAQAVIKGSDADADLAVVAVKLSDLSEETLGKIKVAVLGDSDAVKVGQMAIAIGNAKGMGQSVTVGYISAKDRELEIPDETTGKTMKMNYLQTDAAINGGNSGGPLLDVSGKVVGINSAKISDTQIEGMCYAIPISTAIPIINDLMNRETLSAEERGYMGISLGDVSSEAVENYGVPSGAYIVDVMKDSPAEKAGLKAKDIITKINDTEITSSSAAISKVNSCRAGTEVKVTVSRTTKSGNGYEELEFTVKLATAEEAGVANEDASNKKQENKSQDNDSYNDYYNDFYEDYFNDIYGDSFFGW